MHAEQSLRSSEEIFRLLVEGVRDYAIFMLDPTGHVATWNLGAERIKGYAAEEIIGQHISVFYDEEQVARRWPQHELMVAAAEGRFEDEGWRVRKDGTLFWASVIITAMYEHGQLRGFSKVTRDLTERRRAEEEVRQARDLLEKRVQERTEELTLANQELRNRAEQIGKLAQELATADRRKNEFLATLAHELRNPLAPISNALNLLRLEKADPAIQEQARKVIERQLGQMVRLVDDLLDISRITSSKLRLRKERIELAAAIQSAQETSLPLIKNAGHQVTVTIPPEPIYLDADLTRLAQVFTNLLNNSAKYTERGGHVWLTATREGREAIVSVRDTGIGIPPEHLPSIFKMFSQVTPALERSGGGLGVGLALAQGIVQLHGGCMEARSEGLGRGSEFIVRLPIADPPVRARAEESGGEAVRPGGLRILIADDNRDAAESLGMLLEIEGHEISIVHDGVAAVETAATFEPDVALLDIGMPGLNGYEVAHSLRGQPAGKRMTLVAITGWGQEEDKRRSMEAGFDHHLIKPVDYKDLVGLLARRIGVGARSSVRPPATGD
ncbi:MAG TPA: ATP-binding protein [Thermoanaerobaculia bacterium]|nr:ATP-binding protein [Thermoanaerobaculia bacterium]